MNCALLKPALTLTALLALAAFASIAPSSATAMDGPSSESISSLPSTIELIGTARDFREASATGGHPDFERQPTSGFGSYVGECQDDLDAEGKPVFNSTGYKVSGQRKDSSGRQVIPVDKPYINIDIPSGKRGTVATSAGGSTTTAANFAQWFRDVPGVNSSMPVRIKLVRQNGTNIYTFDDKNDDLFKSRGGFFPINGELFGNSRGDNKNFHFTFEVATRFTYRRGTGQVFTFTGDDDVFVFIGGKLAIDLGGVHGAVSQSVDLDTLTHLTDGQSYELKLFFAERHRTQSNMRIDTTIALENAERPAVAGLFD